MDYHSFFKLCGFTEDAIKEQSPRIDKTFQKLGITEEDVRRAEGRIQYYYDTNLEGVRKLLGVHVKEMINLVLAREENRKVIYCEWPGSASALLMSGVHTVDDAYFGTPASQTINVVMGCIFDKLGPIMEAGGGEWPAGWVSPLRPVADPPWRYREWDYSQTRPDRFTWPSLRHPSSSVRNTAYLLSTAMAA